MEYDYRPLPELIPAELLARAEKLSSPNICDGLTKLKLNPVNYTMDAAIKPVCDSMKIVATASTVDTKDGDNLPIHVGIYNCKPGYCLVVAGILSGKTSRNTGQLPMYFIRNSLGLCVVETCERKLLVFSGICRRGQLQIPASKVFFEANSKAIGRD